MRTIAMKITPLLFILTITSIAKSQSDLIGTIPVQTNQNSIIRTWNDSLIIYAEKRNGGGAFHLLNHLTNGSIVSIADMPNNIHVKDFKTIDSMLFFVGTTNNNLAIFGYFNPDSVFYYNGNINYTILANYTNTILNYSGVPSVLLRMEVYSINHSYHIVASGKTYEIDTHQKTSDTTTCVIDIPIPGNQYDILSSHIGFSEGVFCDIAQTDNYIISIAHKGVPDDLSIAGYIMLHAFDKDNDPLQSLSGTTLTIVNRNVNGLMTATGTYDEYFALTYCFVDTFDASLLRQELLSMKVSSGTINLDYCFLSPYATGAPYYTFHDMDYMSAPALFCNVGTYNSVTTNKQLDIMNQSLIHKIQYSSIIKTHSTCSWQSDQCVTSGSDGSSLIITYQQIHTTPFPNCGTTTAIPLSSIPANTLSGTQSIPDNGPIDSYSYSPQISNKVFNIICK